MESSQKIMKNRFPKTRKPSLSNVVDIPKLAKDLEYFQVGMDAVVVNVPTIPTAAGNNYVYTTAPFKGRLVGAFFTAFDALAAHDTNFITFGLTNLGQAGAGSAGMLAATDVNTTKITGGTALAANTKRALTVHATPANLLVAAGDRLRFAPIGGGTLANTVTGGVLVLVFQRMEQ